MTYNVLCERLSPPVMMTFIHQYMVDYTIPYHTIPYHSIPSSVKTSQSLYTFKSRLTENDVSGFLMRATASQYFPLYNELVK